MLPPSQLKQLGEVFTQAPVESLLFEEGLVGIDPTDINATVIRRAAAAFAHTLASRGDLQSRRGPVLIGSDGRPTPSELLAAAAEGLRMENVDVLEVGPATTGSITHAMHTLSACGGLLIGNARSVRREVSLKFWGTAGTPISAGDNLTVLEQRRKANPTRNSRCSGSISRINAEGDYLEILAAGFHALRPLLVGIQCSNASWWRYLHLLSGNVACQFYPTQLRNQQEQQSLEHDFSLSVDGDGEACQVWDEQGQPASTNALLCLLAVHQLIKHGSGTVVVSDPLPAKLKKKITRHGGRVEISSGNSRAEMHQAMRQTEAVLGCDSHNRFWFNNAGPIPDGLQTLSLLLNALSESDAPLSERLAEFS